jgi:hypothetical protein
MAFENNLDTALASLAQQLADIQLVITVVRELRASADHLHLPLRVVLQKLSGV